MLSTINQSLTFLFILLSLTFQSLVHAGPSSINVAGSGAVVEGQIQIKNNTTYTLTYTVLSKNGSNGTGNITEGRTATVGINAQSSIKEISFELDNGGTLTLSATDSDFIYELLNSNYLLTVSTDADRTPGSIIGVDASNNSTIPIGSKQIKNSTNGTLNVEITNNDNSTTSASIPAGQTSTIQFGSTSNPDLKMISFQLGNGGSMTLTAIQNEFISGLLNTNNLLHVEAYGPPNVVYFLIDDLGLISTPAYGASTVYYPPSSSTASDLNTPNIDAFAQEALLFTHCYATPSCAPSRAELISGQYPYNSGIVYPQYNSNVYLGYGDREDQVTNTWANLLKNTSDYNTAFGGKWNLRWGLTVGSTYPDSEYNDQVDHLNECGFDNTYSFIGNTIYYKPTKFPEDKLNGTTAPSGSYFPTELNNFATKYVNICLENEPAPSGFVGDPGKSVLLLMEHRKESHNNV